MAAMGPSPTVVLVVMIMAMVVWVDGYAGDIDKIRQQHRTDSLNILVYLMLLITTVLTVWSFKNRRIRYLHETGLALVFGLLVGALIRYTGGESRSVHLDVKPVSSTSDNETLPPDVLWLSRQRRGKNHTYSYRLVSEVQDGMDNHFAQLATFDPEIFFNIILPPIIFNAGYSLKREFFFRNLGSIIGFAFIGTTISAVIIGTVQYCIVSVLGSATSLFDCMYFGTLISATDPVTILAIFNDLHVDVNLYALVFGESLLNDVVAIVLATSVENYAKLATSGADISGSAAFFHALSTFLYVFGLSLLLGISAGCATALVTKFTRLRDFPLLESSLFLLMSYSSSLIAEVCDLSGIVTVLFCGICQAHYTYNNLSNESRLRTKNFFQLLNFLAENFIFSYIGVSLFTFPRHQWDVVFISSSFVVIALGRFCNIYPLSALFNIRRKPKLPANFQHMMFLSGLRGAMAFALAIRSTYTAGRQTVYTATSIIVAVTVLYGGVTTQLMLWLGIPVGNENEGEITTLRDNAHSNITRYMTPGSLNAEHGEARVVEQSCLDRMWSRLDTRYFQPLLTHSRPTLIETMPLFCHPLSKFLTSTEQMCHGRVSGSNDVESNNSAIFVADNTVGDTPPPDAAHPFNNRQNPSPLVSVVSNGINDPNTTKATHIWSIYAFNHSRALGLPNPDATSSISSIFIGLFLPTPLCILCELP